MRLDDGPRPAWVGLIEVGLVESIVHRFQTISVNEPLNRLFSSRYHTPQQKFTIRVRAFSQIRADLAIVS
jgi:hypothetical protein